MKSICQKILREILENFFVEFGIKYKNHEDCHLLLTRYFNFRLKYIVLRKRQIRVSKDLSDKIASHSKQDALFEIFSRTINGYDINPFQSKESFNADFHDLLFNDWGIHHLHLSTYKKREADYFYERTGDLLFVRFTDEIAYFLDIKHHTSNNVWSNRDLIRIIQQNWPDSIADKEVPNVTFAPDVTDEEIGILRRKGYIVGINVDGKAYMLLGHGQATSGDNMMAGRMADEVWRWIGENYHLLDINIGDFQAELRSVLNL